MSALHTAICLRGSSDNTKEIFLLVHVATVFNLIKGIFIKKVYAIHVFIYALHFSNKKSPINVCMIYTLVYDLYTDSIIRCGLSVRIILKNTTYAYSWDPSHPLGTNLLLDILLIAVSLNSKYTVYQENVRTFTS